MTGNNITKPWYKKRWGLVIAILLFPYFLLWYMWFKSKRNTTVKIAVSILCGFFIIISLVAIANPNPQTKTANKVASTSTKKTVGSTESSATKKTTNPTKTTATTTQPVVTTADLITEPQAGIAPFISAISGASKSVDLVMYQLEDQQVESALASDASNGITVRVLLNKGYYGEQSTDNEAAYNYLNSHGVQVKWTPSYFALTHQKTLIIDDKTADIMTLNFTPQYYSTSRDFSVTDNDPSDVSAIETTFNADWNSNKITAPSGADLVWSPGSQAEMVSLINNAQKTIEVYNEEMSDSAVISALEQAAERGVSVEVVMTNSSDWKTDFTNLTNAGVQIRTYASSASLYIHAKMILTDGTNVFLGSENFSSSSLDDNRELGINLTSSTVISSLESTFSQDWQGATAFTVTQPSTSSSSNSSSSGSSSTSTSEEVKLSDTGICHLPGDPYYDETTHYTLYPTMAACEAAGGRPSEN